MRDTLYAMTRYILGRGIAVFGMLVVGLAVTGAGCRWRPEPEPDRFDAAWQKLIRSSTRQGNIFIEVTELTVSTSGESGGGIALNAAFNGAHASIENNLAQYGFRIGIASGDVSAIIRAVSQQAKRVTKTTRAIAVLPGNVGVLELASGPTVETNRISSGTSGTLSVTGDRLEVIPVIDDTNGTIVIKIMPVTVSGGSVSRVSTIVRVASGQSVIIAANRTATGNMAENILSGMTAGGRTDRMLILRAFKPESVYNK